MGSVERHLSQRHVVERYDRFMRDHDAHARKVAKILVEHRTAIDAAEAKADDAQKRLDTAGVLLQELRVDDDRQNTRAIRQAAILAHVYVIVTDWRPWVRWRARRELRRLFGREKAK